MDIRQEQLLRLVIENYIATAEPIGSRFLVEKGGLEVSEATVRNELRSLEEEGFLTHPHTSAGRIPTTRGYRHYLKLTNLEACTASKANATALEKAFSLVKEYEVARKNVAKAAVDITKQAILIAFSPEKIYYTGLTQLFSKPDFEGIKWVTTISEIFDRCEEYLPDFFEHVAIEPRYYLGNEHPFGPMLTVLSARFGPENESLIALVGPERMDYKYNWGVIKKIKQII